MINISDSKDLIVNSGTIVEIHKNLKIRGYIHEDVPFTIVCDLKDIAKEKHSMVIQTLQSMI